MEEIADIVQIKNEVLRLVCKYAFEGNLNEKLDDIPYEMIDGIKPKFRCCVYREREIIRQRVRMAMGKLPSDTVYKELEPSQVVHVIPCACEGCPIARFTVTDNCQSCLAQKCIKACAFGAIIKTPKGAVIDKTKCKNCGKCYSACPYHAIVDIERPCKVICPVDAISIDENDIAIIDKDKCINCGVCVVGCPFGAISDIAMVTNVIDELRAGVKVYAMIAPSIEGQFGKDVTLPMIKSAIKKLGFAGVHEVALGADAVAYSEAQELIERKSRGEKMTSSCCPAFVNLIEQHFPELMKNVSTVIPPMAASARYLREKEPDAVIVFIGPCIAKKSDTLRHFIDLIPYTITFEELYAMFQAKGIDPAQEAGGDEEEATRYGRDFARAGGVTSAVLKAVEELGGPSDVQVVQCQGCKDCKTQLRLLKAGRMSEDFIEGMGCEKGCIGGPATIKELNPAAFDRLATHEKRDIGTHNEEKGIDKIHIHR